MTRGGREKDQGRPGTQVHCDRGKPAEGGSDPLLCGPEVRSSRMFWASCPAGAFMSRPTVTAIDKAAKKGLFARAARQPVKVPEGLPDLVEALLAAGGGIALAWRARRAMR
jgi:uncharacterized protein